MGVPKLWLQGQEISLVPPFSNLSKYTVLNKVLATLLGLFGFCSRGFVPPCPRYGPDANSLKIIAQVTLKT